MDDKHAGKNKSTLVPHTEYRYFITKKPVRAWYGSYARRELYDANRQWSLWCGEIHTVLLSTASESLVKALTHASEDLDRLQPAVPGTPR